MYIKYGGDKPVVSTSPICLDLEIETEEQLTPRFDATNLKLPSSVRYIEYGRSNSLYTAPHIDFALSESCVAKPLAQVNQEHPDNEESKSVSEISMTRSTTVTTNDSENSHNNTLNKLRSGRVGFDNPGLYCYMNTGLQLLFTIPDFQSVFLKYTVNFPDRILTNIFSEISRKIFLGKSKKIRPRALWDFLNRYFSPLKMHDLPEFLRFIINKLEPEVPEINQIFQGIFCSKITCLRCQNLSVKFEPFIDLQLELSSNLDKSFSLFTKEEGLTPNYLCPNCKQKTEASKQIMISKAPNYLLIQIKRFRQIPYPHKVSSLIRYKKKMDISNYSDEKCEYELLGVSVHTGSIDNGHYLAYCKRGHS